MKPAHVVKLAKPVVTHPETTTSTLTVERLVEIPSRRVVRAFIRELGRPVVLWEGDAYDAIGQWTDADVAARLLQLF